MKVPASGDIPPLLLAPVKQGFSEYAASDETPKSLKRRRRGREAGSGDDYSWERAPRSSRLIGGDNRRMKIMLFAGGLFFTAIIVGVLMSSRTGPLPVIRDGGKPLESKTVAVEVAPPTQRSEASILKEAEPLVKKFLEASTVDEMLGFVRNPGVAEARMREFYPGGKIEPAGLSKFNSGSRMMTKGKLVSVAVITRNQGEKLLGLVETPQGLKIDWEMWAEWLELPWEKFLLTKPSTHHVFRVILSPVDYYNFGFSDDSKWQSYRLESPGREHGIYGYVEKGSELDMRLRPNVDEQEAMLTLALKFPLDPQSNSQVEIERFVCEGWVEEEESP